jgi:hypothetical protein
VFYPLAAVVVVFVVAIVGPLSTGVLIKKPVRSRFTGITDVVFLKCVDV